MIERGVLIEFEGLDCSFKETNSKLLEKYLKERTSKPVARIDYPRYDNQSSFFIKQYLAGKYGKPNEVPYEIARWMYALDRYHDWMVNIKPLYDQGYIIITDRYTISNMIYQADLNYFDTRGGYDSKSYSNLVRLENELMRLPKPDIIIFMDQPRYIAQYLMEEKNADDILEQAQIDLKNKWYDNFYKLIGAIERKELYPNVMHTTITCGENGLPRDRKDIFKDITNFIDKFKGLYV